MAITLQLVPGNSPHAVDPHRRKSLPETLSWF